MSYFQIGDAVRIRKDYMYGFSYLPSIFKKVHIVAAMDKKHKDYMYGFSYLPSIFKKVHIVAAMDKKHSAAGRHIPVIYYSGEYSDGCSWDRASTGIFELVRKAIVIQYEPVSESLP